MDESNQEDVKEIVESSEMGIEPIKLDIPQDKVAMEQAPWDDTEEAKQEEVTE